MADSNGHFPLAHESDDLIPLPDAHRQGLTAVAVLAAISIVSSTAVLVYLTVKLIRWHIKTSREARRQALRCSSVDLSLGLAERYFSRSNDDSSQHGRGPPVPSRTTEKVYPNQFLVLLYNLLLADIHQSGAFLLNAVWVGRNGIEVRKATCFAQGWLVSTGDLASSCFITAIAVHTYMAVVWHYKPPQWALYVAIVGLWVFDYLMAALGLVTTNNGREFGGFYVRAAAWCWVNVKYDTHRLVLHYLFIFISLAVTSVLYLLIFLSLRKRRRQESPDLQLPSNSTNITGHHHQNANSTSSSTSTTTTHTSTTNKTRNTTTTTTNPSPTNRNNTIARANSGGHHNAFLLYPVIYVICTAPLALGRIATMAGAQVPISYFCTAGALITSNGWLDVLLWGVTRHSLLFGGDIGSQESGLDTFAFMRTPPERRYGNIVWVEGSAGPQSRRGAWIWDKKREKEEKEGMAGLDG
ncbi:hypothetical protein B0T17DRAFT_615439 [Bombardia bombarda]|uniref:Glucose receptor Git3 N-terminal domain-containing protein n=1 Tax=Bombardia bombarda TaxID=252184 RepID=A0AA39X9L7_9PEZI|nr:hypothetical protein B0T17DRAFT_615439 [Bombardia bombarda]